MVSPLAADDQDGASASADNPLAAAGDPQAAATDATGSAREHADQEPGTVHGGTDDASGAVEGAPAPARPAPTHLRALPPQAEGAPASTAASTAAAGPAAAFGSTGQIPRLRDMVRHEGRTPEEAARELGIDPIIASMWLRLPENLWGTGPMGPVAPLVPIAAPPIGGVMRVLSCRVPAPAFERLRAGDGSVVERANAALAAGLQALDAGMVLPVTGARWRGFTRPLALTVDGDAYVRLRDIASQAFEDDMRDAAGWLIARGAGVSMTNPAPARPAVETAAPVAAPVALRTSVAVPGSGPAPARPLATPVATPEGASDRATPPAAPRPVRKERVIEAIRARAVPRASLPPDDSAPDGDELRRRRDLVGISQRDLAAASGLSRGLVAEVERGRRRHVMTRARIAETLASVAAEKGVSLDVIDTSVAV